MRNKNKEYSSIISAERLIREQKIERRIARQQRDFHPTGFSRVPVPEGGGRRGEEGATATLNLGRPDRRSLLQRARTELAYSSYSADRSYQNKITRALSARANRIIATSKNTDLCYVLGLFLALMLLSATLHPNGTIVSHTFQPSLFSLPRIENNQLSVYVSNQVVEASTPTDDLQNYSAFQERKYIVQSGQTLSQLSLLHNVSMSTLISFNEISNARSLQAGSVYSIPDREGILHVVTNDESIEQVAQRYQVGVNTILDVNNLPSASLERSQKLFIPGAALSDFDLRLSLGELFARPVQGRLSSGFGYRSDPFTGVRRFHYGHDFATRQGTPVLAAMEGRVSYIGEQTRGYGRYIIIRHPGGFQSLYAHLSGYNVRSGQYVSRGQTVGWVGNSGRSTGPHLHFSIIKNGKFVSPAQYLY